jgi:hypothetical protein
VTLNSGDNNGQVYLQQSASGMTLTNSDNMIQGYGVVGNGGLTVVNSAAGTIAANVSGRTLVLNGSGGITNLGLLEATNGGILQISAVVNNLNGNVTANAGTVNVNSTIQGGVLNSLNDGTLQTVGTATLDGSSQGPVTLSAGSTYYGSPASATNVQGTIVNFGNIQPNAGSGNNTFLQFTGNTTLQGGGTVTLNSGDNNGQVYLQQSASSVTLTNVDNTIQGYGVIGNGGLTIANNAAGTIDANVRGPTMLLNGGGGIANAGLLEGTNGGVLQISAVVNNLNGNVTANAGTVNVNSTIQGGTLNSINGGTLQTVGTATLDGSSQGPVTLSAGSTYYGSPASVTNVQGTIVNFGNIQPNAGSGNTTYVQFAADTTLQGGGTVTLNSGDLNGQVYLQQSASSVTLTNVDNTIEGYGVIGYNGLALINQAAGTLLANSAGNTLLVNGSGGLANDGTLQANAGSTLQVASNLTNFSSDTLTGGTYVVNGSSSAAAALQLSLGSNSGGEIVNNAATIVLDGPAGNTRFLDSNGNNALSNLAANSTASSNLTVQDGYVFQTVGDFSNAGTVVVGGNGSGLTVGPGGGNTYTQTGGNTLINSGGTLSAQAINLMGGSLYLNNNATLTNPLTLGSGTIGGLGTFAPPGGVVIGTSQVVAPGIAHSLAYNLSNTAIGALNFGTGLTLASGGTYVWELGDASGAAGTGWDEILVAGTLTITSTPGAPFFLTVFSASDNPLYSGPVVFDNTQHYSWTIASASGGIAGFDPSAIDIDSSEFTAVFGSGQFFLTQTGNDLMLNFTPVPEPSTYALLGLGLGVMVVAGRRRRKLKAQ